MSANLESLRVAAVDQARILERDHSLRVKIVPHLVKNETLSAESGTEVFDEVPMAEIYIIGDAMNVVHKPEKSLNPKQKELFRPLFAWFKASREHVPESGTPLEDVAWLKTGQVNMFKASNIFTLEALAGLSDHAIGKLGMGVREQVKKAQGHLAVAKDQAAASAALERDAAQKAEIAHLQGTVADLTKKLDAFIKETGLEIPEQLKRRA
jgi:hypothetical protein